MRRSLGLRVGGSATLGLLAALLVGSGSAQPATTGESHAEGVLRLQSDFDIDLHTWTATCADGRCVRDAGGSDQTWAYVGGPFRSATCAAPFDRVGNCGVPPEAVSGELPDGMSNLVLMVVPRLWARELTRVLKCDPGRSWSRFALHNMTCGADAGLPDSDCVLEATGPMAWTTADSSSEVPRVGVPSRQSASLWVPGLVLSGTPSKVKVRRVADALNFWGLGTSATIHGYRAANYGRGCGDGYSVDRHGRVRRASDLGRFLVAVEGRLVLRFLVYNETWMGRCGREFPPTLWWQHGGGQEVELAASMSSEEIRIWRESGGGTD